MKDYFIYNELIKKVIKNNITLIWGSTHDQDNREYVADTYKHEFNDMCDELSRFIVSCEEVEYEFTIDELKGVIIYMWTTFCLNNINDFNGFEIMAYEVNNEIELEKYQKDRYLQMN
jgi:hypothetical protein